MFLQSHVHRLTFITHLFFFFAFPLVHKLQPKDIKLVAAMGDWMTVSTGEVKDGHYLLCTLFRKGRSRSLVVRPGIGGYAFSSALEHSSENFSSPL